MGMVLWTSEVGEEGKKPWWAAMALYRGQGDSTVGKTVGGMPWILLIHRSPLLVWLKGQPEADTCEFQSRIPNHAT